MDILSTNKEGKQKYYNEHGKTSLKNLRGLTSDSEISTFLHIGRLLIPEELLFSFYSSAEIEKILDDVKESKSEQILNYLSKKWIYNETGDDVKIKDFINYSLNINLSLRGFKAALKKREFKIYDLDNFILEFQNQSSIKEKGIQY